MQTTCFQQRRKLALPFVGRKKELALLQRLHLRRKHGLILGSLGVGKTALVNQLKEKLNLLVCQESENFTAIFDSLEAQLELAGGNLKPPQRKRRLLLALAVQRQTVVFDSVKWITPKLSSFLECAMERVPVWICTRSEHPWDIGHFWTCLVRFEKVEMHPFHFSETRELIKAVVETGQIPIDAENIAGWLHARSAGNPLILHELFQELATNSYDLSNPIALRRLDLDRRIHEIFPYASTSKRKDNR